MTNENLELRIQSLHVNANKYVYSELVYAHARVYACVHSEISYLNDFGSCTSEADGKLNRNEVSHIFHAAYEGAATWRIKDTAKILAKMHHYKHIVEAGARSYHATQEPLDLLVNARNAFSHALIDRQRLTIIAPFYLYEILWTVFSRSFVCRLAWTKNRRRVPGVAKLRELLSVRDMFNSAVKNIARFNRMKKLTSYFDILHWRVIRNVIMKFNVLNVCSIRCKQCTT